MEEQFNLPKLSFIVISHNFERYILQCLKSITSQTYQNIEIIIVDDCSEDKTSEIIENFIKTKEDKIPVKLIKNEKNIGQLNSFLVGLEQAEGQFVAQIDGDDVLFQEYAAMHIETHMQTPVALTTCQQIEIDDDNTIHTLTSIDCPVWEREEFFVHFKNLNEFEEYRNGKNIYRESSQVKVLDNARYSFATWHWGPASSGVMRKSVCDILLNLNRNKNLKITADKFIFSFCHLIGSSAIIYKPLYAYRRHNSNYSLANPVMGNKKYFHPSTQKNYFRNNRRIRTQMFKFVFRNRKYFKENFNSSNLMLIYKRIIFSFDKNTLKGIFKALFI